MNSLLKELQKLNADKDKRISELYVVIDTLQTNLRSAVAEIPLEGRDKVTKVQSYQWCSQWKPGDEKS